MKKKINILECEVWEIKWVADGGNPWGGNPPSLAGVELPWNTIQPFLHKDGRCGLLKASVK